MIAQLLNRDFVFEQAQDLLPTLDEQAQGGRRSLPPRELEEAYPEIADLEPADYQAGKELLEIGLARETPAANAAEARGDLPPVEDFVYLSGDPGLSLLQTAFEAYVDVLAPELASRGEVADDRRGGSQDEVAVTDRFLTGFEPFFPKGRRLFGRFSQTDPRWVSSLLAMGARWFRNKLDFPDAPAPHRPIDNRSRLVLVADWGSGLPRAAKVATEIRKILNQGKAEGRQQHVMHLGDVYYSGWAYEYRKRFLENWPVRLDEAGEISSWNLNGNHDMYSGGHAYFGTSLGDPRFAPYHRGSSHFSLSTDHWQILGLDTAFEDHGLAGNQASWARESLIGAGERKGLLLSHHQIFSSHENVSGKKLLEKIQPVLTTGKVDCWFWGHEHRCVGYGPHSQVANARCVGHGGVPVYMFHQEDDPIASPGIFEYRRRFDRGLPFEHWAIFGFAVLDFDGPKIDVRYIDEDGNVHHRETIG